MHLQRRSKLLSLENEAMMSASFRVVSHLQHVAQTATTPYHNKLGFDLIDAAAVSDDRLAGDIALSHGDTARIHSALPLRLCFSGLPISSDLI
jgi:hypothetical protein